MKVKIIVAALASTLLIILAGCTPRKTVTITYRPLANTRKIMSNKQVATAEEGMFRIYRIEKIDNNEAEAEDFHYVNLKVHLVNNDGAKLMTLLRDGDQYYSHQSLEDNFKAGTVSPNLPFYLVFFSNPGEEPNESWTPLKYASSTGESVLMVQASPNSPFYMAEMTSQDLPFE